MGFPLGLLGWLTRRVEIIGTNFICPLVAWGSGQKLKCVDEGFRQALSPSETKHKHIATMVRTRSGLSTTGTSTSTPVPTTIPDGSEIPTGTCIVCGETFRIGGCEYGHFECCAIFLRLVEEDEPSMDLPDGVRVKFVNVMTSKIEEDTYDGYVEFKKSYELAIPVSVVNVDSWVSFKWDAICDYSFIDTDTSFEYTY